MDRFVERAIVLSTVDFGEADRVVTLLTHGRGKLSVFAAGARKSKRRFAGALEPFTLIRAHVVERRGDTFRIDAADIEQTFPRARSDLTLIARALYVTELCRELLREREPHPELFELTERYLGQLDAREAGPTSLLAFELDALAFAGLRPRFSPCASCGEGLRAMPRFDPAHGGVLCEECCHRTGQRGAPVTPEMIDALAALQAGARTPLPAVFRQRARELLSRFIEYHLGRRLRSVDFMRQVGVD